MTDAQHRDKIERDLVREYAQTGRTASLGTPEFERALAQRLVAAGVARPEDRDRAKEGAYGDIRKASRDLDAFMRDDLASDPKTRGLLGTEAHDEMRASAFQAAGLPMPPDLKRRMARAARQQQAQGPFSQLMQQRGELRRTLEDEYAADPKKRPLIGGGAFSEELSKRYKAGGLDTAEDAPRGANLRGVGIGVFGMIGGISQSVRGGQGVGNAVGQIAQGLERGVIGAASGFIRAGETALGLFLAPFGKAGASLGRMVGGLGGGMVAALQAGGAVAGGVVKAGAGLIGGAAGLGVGAVGAGLGAAVGSVVPGLGTLVGAGLGAGIAGSIMGAVGSALSNLGGAIGQMLGGVGDAVGKLADGIGNALSNVQGVLSDLISTGKDFASSAFSVQRGTGQGLGSAGGVVSLSKILTGNPSGLNGIFSGFGMEGPYMSQRARAFGVNVGPNAGFLDILQRSQGAFNRLGGGFEGSIRRGEMVNGLFGGNQDIANLLSSGMAGKAVSYARATAPSAKEMRQDFAVSMDLSLVGRQLDMIKMKFLTDLMPVIKLGVGMFGSFINKNMGGIIGGLKAAGEWLFVQFPAMLGRGINLLFEFGKSFALAIPQIAQFGSAIFGLLAGMGNALKPFAGVLITIGAALGAIPRKDARAALEGIRGMPNIDPHALDPMFEKAASMGPSAFSSLNNAQVGFNKYYGGATGTEAQRQRTLDAAKRGMNEGGGPGGVVRVESKLQLEINDNPSALYKLKTDVTHHMAQQMVRAQARAGA